MEYKTISLASQVYDRLEADILSGKYKHGEVLTELGLCADMGVSRTPIREALRRLEQEKLVEDIGKGTLVLGITRKDFEDMCAVRLRIEGLAVRGFIENATEDSLAALREALDFQEFYLQKGDADHMRIMDGRFHEVIYDHCNSPVIRNVLSPMHKKIQHFRQLSIKQSGRAIHSVEEHHAIYDAIIAKDIPLAEELMIRHVENAMNTIIRKENTTWD